jgi:hypothetical protein
LFGGKKDVYLRHKVCHFEIHKERVEKAKNNLHLWGGSSLEINSSPLTLFKQVGGKGTEPGSQAADG